MGCFRRRKATPVASMPKLRFHNLVFEVPVGTTWIVIEGNQLSFIGPQSPAQDISQDDDEFYASDGFDEDSPDFF
jgi:hypothetical protein